MANQKNKVCTSQKVLQFRNVGWAKALQNLDFIQFCMDSMLINEEAHMLD